MGEEVVVGMEEFLDFFRRWYQKSEVIQWFLSFDGKEIYELDVLRPNAGNKERMLKDYLGDIKGSLVTRLKNEKLSVTSDKALDHVLTLRKYILHPQRDFRVQKILPNGKCQVKWLTQPKAIEEQEFTIKQLLKMVNFNYKTYSSDKADEFRFTIKNFADMLRKAIREDKVLTTLKGRVKNFPRSEQSPAMWKGFMINRVGKWPFLLIDLNNAPPVNGMTQALSEVIKDINKLHTLRGYHLEFNKVDKRIVFYLCKKVPENKSSWTSMVYNTLRGH